MTTPTFNQTQDNQEIQNAEYSSVKAESSSKISVESTSYVLIVLEMMQQIGLGPIEDLMQTESQLMNVTAEIQSDLTTIQSFLSKIENLAHSGAAWELKNGKNFPFKMSKGSDGFYDQNAYNALYQEFKENPNVRGDVDKSTVASDFETSVKNFLSAFKDLYTAQSCDPGDEMAQSNFKQFSVNKLKNGKSVQETFNLEGTYSDLNSNKQGWGLVSSTSKDQATFGTSPTMKASLIQQYTYYQYKLAAEQNKEYIPGANVKLIPFSMDPTSNNFDGVGRSLLGLLNSFNTTITVNREGDTNHHNAGQLSNTSGRLLDYILKDPYEYQRVAGCKSFDGQFKVNIYGALSFAAFNYFWTQNPNASVDKGSNPEPQPQPIESDGHTFDYSLASDKGVASGDKLSIWYSDSQSSSSLVSSGSSESSTTMQEYTSEVSQYQNIGQNIVKTNSDSNLAIVNNFKTG